MPYLVYRFIMNTTPSLCLVILDGFGYKKNPVNNPLAALSMPFWNQLMQVYPHTLLEASGTAVGLPKETQGNSEVGHRTLGAGRIIPSVLSRINDDITSGAFFKHPLLTKLFEHNISKKSTFHLVGLVSDGNVHGSLNHAIALAAAAHQAGVTKIVLHAILDGRDVPPHSARTYLEKVLQETQKYGVQLGSLQGRFYAMDRDKNDERTTRAYETIVGKSGTLITSYAAYLEHEYSAGRSDEFALPARFDEVHAPYDDDVILFFNIRPERTWQLAEKFFEHNATNHFKLASLVDYTTDVEPLYSETDQGKSFFTFIRASQPEKKYAVLAESEKEAHVAYYFTNLSTLPFVSKTIIPSRKDHSPADNPTMQAPQITAAALQFMQKNTSYCAVINYANADMVGHSGNYQASLKALSCLDEQLKALYNEVVKKQNNILVITADHGNVENKSVDNDSCRSHTTNPVPFLVASQHPVALEPSTPAGLSAVAPTLLSLMGIRTPEWMQKSLLKN